MQRMKTPFSLRALLALQKYKAVKSYFCYKTLQVFGSKTFAVQCHFYTAIFQGTLSSSLGTQELLFQIIQDAHLI